MKYKTDTSFLNKQGKVNTFEMNTVYFKGGTITSSLLHKILLQVVTVDLGSTENNCLIHLVFLDGSDSILPLQDFNSFRPHLLNNTTTITKKNTEFQSEIVRNTHNHTDLQLNSLKISILMQLL